MEVFDLQSRFTKIFEGLISGTKHRTSKILKQLIASRIMSGEAISDTGNFSADAIKVLFDWIQSLMGLILVGDLISLPGNTILACSKLRAISIKISGLRGKDF